LLKVSLAAIPLLLNAQCTVARQVYAAVGASHHRRGVLFARGAIGLIGGGRLEFTPQPNRGENQDDPEQYTKHDERLSD
jgi:hypothetical protein